MDSPSWQPFSLFETLLNNSEALLQLAKQDVPEFSGFSRSLHLATVGFSQYAPDSKWTSDHTEFIQYYLTTDYSPEALTWYEDDADAIAAFASLSLGAVLGLYQTGTIGQNEIVLGEAHLAGFISLNDGQIATRFGKNMA